MRRAFRVHKNDGSFEDLEISRVAAIKDKNGSMSIMLHLDKLPDGTWRVTFNQFHIPDLTMIRNIEIIRED